MATSPDHHPMPDAKRQRLNPCRIHPQYLRNMSLIYADDQLEENNDDFQKVLAELRRRIKDVKSFNKASDCIQFFTQVKSERVIAIMSGAISEDLLPKVDSLPQVYAIYLIDVQADRIGQWLKVRSVHNNIVSIYPCIEDDINQYRENYVPITFGSTVNDSLDPSFILTRLFLKILLRMKYDEQSLQEYLSFIRRKYANNKVACEITNHFPQTYRSMGVLPLYNLRDFIYEEVNRACRLLEADSIIHMAFLIHDLCNKIKALHKKQMSSYGDAPFHLYRGQAMSVEDFQKSYNEKGQLVAFNGFLLTSRDENVACVSAKSNSFGHGKVGVLLDIKIDPKTKSNPFVKINGRSMFRQEWEYLFSMHSVFRTGTIKPLEGNDSVYRVELIQTTDDDPEMCWSMDKMELELSHLPDDEKLRVLLMRIGQGESAENCYLDSLNQGEDVAREEKLRCYQELAAIKRDQGMYAEALNYLEGAMATERSVSPDDERTLEGLHQSMGEIYTLMEKHSDALTHYEESLELRKKHCPSNDILLASSYNSIAMTYHKLRNSPKALSYLEDACSIMNHYHAANHPCFAKIYLNIGIVNMAMKNFTVARDYREKALEILQNALPKDHPWLADAHCNIGATHAAKGELKEALSHHQQVLCIFNERGSLAPRLLAATYNSIGLIYLKEGNYNAALSKLKEAVETFDLMSPKPENTCLARCYLSMAEAYFKMKKYTNASSEYERALIILNKALPTGPNVLFDIYKNLGISYSMTQDYQRAIAYFKQALENVKKTQPNNHEALADVYIRMGGVYDKLGECQPTKLCYVEALDIQRRYHIPLDPVLVNFSDDLISLAMEVIRNRSPTDQ